MKLTSVAGCVLVALLCGTASAQEAPSTLVASAIADPARPASDVQQDASRHPAELIAFSKVKPGDVVQDVWPGGGYWLRLFSTIVGKNGKVFAYVPAEITDFKPDPLAIAKTTAAEPGRGNVEARSHPLTAFPPPQFQNMFDVIWIFQNYHDLHDSFMKGADVDAYNRVVFALLKPGGYYVISDHAAAPGSGLRNTGDLHRIDPAAVKAEVLKAGFVLDAQTDILANPEDDHMRKIFDPAIKGKTDRFVFRFRKPAE